MKQQDIRLGLFLAILPPPPARIYFSWIHHKGHLGIYRITETIDQYTHYIAEETEA